MYCYQELFSESFARTMLDDACSQALIQAFAANFFNGNERIESLFKDLDATERGTMLHGSILQMSAFASTGYRDHRGLQELAERHRILAITRREYTHWQECLVQAVAASDPLYKAEIGDAWRISMAPGIAYLLLRMPIAA